MATPTQTDPYAAYQDAAPASQGAASASSSDPYAAYQEPKDKATEARTKEPGILETANKYYEGRPAIPVAPTEEYASNLLHRIGSSAGRTAMMIPNMAAGLYHAAVDDPTLDEVGLSDQQRIAKRLLYDPSAQAIEQEKQHEAKDAEAGMPHSTTEKVLNRAVSAVPLVGPFVEGEGQRAGRGDWAGAAADVGAMELLPRIAKESMPGGRLPGAAAKGEEAFPITRSAAQGTVRGAAKTYNAVRKAAPVVAPIVGAAEGYAHGGLPGAAYGSVTGGTLGKVASHLPEAPESLTRYGLKPIELGEPTAEPSPLKPIGSKVTEPASELKPIGSTAEATPKAPEESAEVRRARHVLGNVAVDKLKTAEGGPEALRRLTKGTYQQYADLANALEIRKPGYLAAKNGETWTADEFQRTTKTHGKELSAPKEMVVRDLLSKPPAEILQHTQPWVDPTAKYAAPMSSLTERTMKALGLSEEAKNNLRASGVSDTQAQSLLAKLTKRQLENLSETMEKGEHLPTVSGGSQGADLLPNASGESSASLENINRVASQKAKGLKIYRLNSLSGQATPILAQDAVDWRPGPAEHKIEVDGEGNISVLESGSRAHPVMKSSKIRFPKD
jgi:hypothetical protein